MKISTKARYGIRALIDVAIHGAENPVSLGEIAEREAISEKYLEHLFRQLKTSGIVRSVKGSRGGYLLTRSADKITAYEIIAALEGSLTPVDCVDDSGLCDRVSDCVTRELWTELKLVIENYLKSKTLADLAKTKEELSKGFVYHI